MLFMNLGTETIYNLPVVIAHTILEPVIIISYSWDVYQVFYEPSLNALLK